MSSSRTSINHIPTVQCWGVSLTPLVTVLHHQQTYDIFRLPVCTNINNDMEFADTPSLCSLYPDENSSIWFLFSSKPQSLLNTNTVLFLSNEQASLHCNLMSCNTANCKSFTLIPGTVNWRRCCDSLYKRNKEWKTERISAFRKTIRVHQHCIHSLIVQSELRQARSLYIKHSRWCTIWTFAKVCVVCECRYTYERSIAHSTRSSPKSAI